MPLMREGALLSWPVRWKLGFKNSKNAESRATGGDWFNSETASFLTKQNHIFTYSAQYTIITTVARAKYSTAKRRQHLCLEICSIRSHITLL